MSRFTADSALTRVLSFTIRLWMRKPGLVVLLLALVLAAIAADIAIPVITGRLVAAVAEGSAPWAAFATLLGIGSVSIAAKVLSYFCIIDLTIPTMRSAEAEAFAHVQRLPADWHANAFAGSTVRKITRGAWALDDLGDVLLLALLPSMLILLGTIGTLTAFRWEVGLTALVGAVFFMSLSVAMTLYWVAPAARLANAQDSRVSGALADAITSNAVVRAHAGELREDGRLGRIARGARGGAGRGRGWRRMALSGACGLPCWVVRC